MDLPRNVSWPLLLAEIDFGLREVYLAFEAASVVHVHVVAMTLFEPPSTCHCYRLQLCSETDSPGCFEFVDLH
jgi:hypothetical protein